MLSQLYYIVRSKVDGKYLVAQIDKGEDEGAIRLARKPVLNTGV